MAEQSGNLAISYAQAMEEIKFRLDVVKGELISLRERQGEDDYRKNVISAELCYLQFRRISEVLALAILEAHREQSGNLLKELERDYRADFLIKKVLEAYPRGFPIPVRQTDAKHAGPIDFREFPELFNQQIFKQIYQDCGDKLHVGSLFGLRRGKIKRLDSAELRQWFENYVKGLGCHLLPLSAENQMLYVVMRSAEDGKVHCRYCEVVAVQ